MIEIIPKKVENAFLYLHSADTNSEELRPFLERLQDALPNTYIWAGDGPIAGSPMMGDGTFYGSGDKRYWFMFPMKDSCSMGSFLENRRAMGASLLSAGAMMNQFVDQVMARFQLDSDDIVLSGFQHGSSLALSTALMRKENPLSRVILFEPYLLEAFYLKSEAYNRYTQVVCIDNQHIRQRTYDWISIYTDEEFRRLGMKVKAITVPGGSDELDWNLLVPAVEEMQESSAVIQLLHNV